MGCFSCSSMDLPPPLHQIITFPCEEKRAGAWKTEEAKNAQESSPRAEGFYLKNERPTSIPSGFL